LYPKNEKNCFLKDKYNPDFENGEPKLIFLKDKEIKTNFKSKIKNKTII